MVLMTIRSMLKYAANWSLRRFITLRNLQGVLRVQWGSRVPGCSVPAAASESP